MACGFFTGSSEYTPSTFVPFRTTSASISLARNAAAVSVVTNGLPVPAAKNHYSTLLKVAYTTTSNERLCHAFHSDGALDSSRNTDAFQGILQRQCVNNGRQHSHVMRRRWDDGVTGFGKTAYHAECCHRHRRWQAQHRRQRLP